MRGWHKSKTFELAIRLLVRPLIPIPMSILFTTSKDLLHLRVPRWWVPKVIIMKPGRLLVTEYERVLLPPEPRGFALYSPPSQAETEPNDHAYGDQSTESADTDTRCLCAGQGGKKMLRLRGW